jgi:hypothetical protein
MRRETPFVALLGFFALTTLPGRLAAQTADVEKKERDALAHCDGQDAKKGVALLGRLYADTLDPTYVYNQGRCYQKNGMTREAVTRFREFLRINKDPKSELVPRAREFIAELEGEKKPVAPAANAVPTAPVSAPPPIAIPAPAPAPAPVTSPATMLPPVTSGPADLGLAASAPPSRGRNRLHIASYVAAGLGVLAIGTGAYYGIQVVQTEDDVVKKFMANSKDPAIPGLQADGQAAETRQWVGYGVGAGCLAAGVALYLFGREQTAQGVAFAPLVQSGTGGAIVRGSF